MNGFDRVPVSQTADIGLLTVVDIFLQRTNKVKFSYATLRSKTLKHLVNHIQILHVCFSSLQCRPHF